MSKLFTSNFKVESIKTLRQANAMYYVFVSKHTPYTDESVIPSIPDNVQTTHYDVYDQMIYAKYLDLSTDSALMVPRRTWTPGTVYNMYSHTSPQLFDTEFYVCVEAGSRLDVFKCLFNNNGAPSTIAPDLTSTSESDDIYITSDGYQWKYMYSISDVQAAKFATIDYIPVIPNANVASYAVNGAIDVITIDYGGSNYDSFTNGTFQSVTVAGNTQAFFIESTASANNNFYNGCAIKITSGVGAGQQRTVQSYSVSGSTRQVIVDLPFTTAPTTSSRYEITPNVVVSGDGSGFLARAIVNTAASNSISRVEITQRGNNYSFASVSIVGNTSGATNTAIATSIISPPGGHGSDAPAELGARYMGLSVTFDSTDPAAAGKLLDVNDFRTYGMIRSPLFANVEITYTGAIGTFTLGEIVTQSTTGASGTITFANSTVLRLTNVNRFVIPSGGSGSLILTGANTGATALAVSVRNNGSANITNAYTYVNQTTIHDIASPSGTFVEDEIVTGTSNTTTSNAVLYSANSTVVRVTNQRGTFGTNLSGSNSSATAVITNTTPGDFVRGSGKVVYIENIAAINKSNGQTETIKSIIEF